MYEKIENTSFSSFSSINKLNSANNKRMKSRPLMSELMSLRNYVTGLPCLRYNSIWQLQLERFSIDFKLYLRGSFR